MDHNEEKNVRSGIEKMWRFGCARNREQDRQSRIVELTDDEAIAIVQYIDDLEMEKQERRVT